MQHLLSIALVFAMMSTTAAHAQMCDPQEIAKLLASDGAIHDYLGYSVAISGETVVLGAPCSISRKETGWAYVFRYDGVQWIEEAKLIPSDGEAIDFFGWSVAISGDVIIVGAPENKTVRPGSGAVYVFRYNGEDWVEEAKLIIMDDEWGAHFGRSVSIDGNVIVGGATGIDYNGNMEAGAAYVFRYDGAVWIRDDSILRAPPGEREEFSYFGESVSIDGNSIVVGKPSTVVYGWIPGRAYVFNYDVNENWVLESTLVPSDSAIDDLFGTSVSIDHNYVVVGAPRHVHRGEEFGSAYLFRYNGSEWVETHELLAEDQDLNDQFGISVSIDGNNILIGANYDDNNYNPHTGSAYLFDTVTGQQINKILASDWSSYDEFGYAVTINKDTAVIGSRHAEYYAGKAYVYDLNCTPLLTVSPDPLIAGQDAAFITKYMNPNTKTYLAYSLRGTGSTFIPFLNITLDLKQPKQAGNTITSDNNGTAEWILQIPNAGAGRNVWLQACQFELKTNVVATSIE